MWTGGYGAAQALRRARFPANTLRTSQMSNDAPVPQPPPTSDLVGPGGDEVQQFVAAMRQRMDAEMVPVRRGAEREARELLDRSAGRMSEQQVMELGALFSRDWHRGQMRH